MDAAVRELAILTDGSPSSVTGSVRSSFLQFIINREIIEISRSNVKFFTIYPSV